MNIVDDYEQVARRGAPYPYPNPLPAQARQGHVDAIKRARGRAATWRLVFVVAYLLCVGVAHYEDDGATVLESHPEWAIPVALVVAVLGAALLTWPHHRTVHGHRQVLAAYDRPAREPHLAALARARKGLLGWNIGAVVPGRMSKGSKRVHSRYDRVAMDGAPYPYPKPLSGRLRRAHISIARRALKWYWCISLPTVLPGLSMTPGLHHRFGEYVLGAVGLALTVIGCFLLRPSHHTFKLHQHLLAEYGIRMNHYGVILADR